MFLLIKSLPVVDGAAVVVRTSVVGAVGGNREISVSSFFQFTLPFSSLYILKVAVASFDFCKESKTRPNWKS